jgi:hypothetical protein
LPDREKEIINLKEITSLNNNNINSIQDSLEHSNWPIKKDDFYEIKKRLDLANTYLSLAKNLTDYLQRENLDFKEFDKEKLISNLEKIEIQVR